MRIVQVAPPWLPVPPRKYGGSEYMVGLLSAGLTGEGASVHLFCRETGLPVPAEIIPFPFGTSPDKYSENAYLAECIRRLRSMKPDLVHSHLETFAGFSRLIDHDWPTVITVHIPITEAMKVYMSQFPEVQYVAPGSLQVEKLSEIAPHVVRIPHGIPVERYEFCLEKEPYLLFLGRIMPAKGVEDAVFLSRERDLPLVIAGPVFPADEAYFREKIDPFVDGRRIRYVGEADFAGKNRLLSRASALVHPVKVEEAFGLTLIEAMACGTPVLAYKRGAVGEVVRDRITGCVVDSVADMVQAWDCIEKIDPKDCRRHVEEYFTLEKMVQSYLELYHRLL